MLSDVNLETGAIVDGAERLARGRQPPLLRRIRFQLGGAVLLGLAGPLVLTWPLAHLASDPLGANLPWPSIMATLTAIVVGYFLVRRFSPFGTRASMANTVPCLLVSFTAVGAGALLLGTDVSLVFLAIGFALAANWLLLSYDLRNRIVPPTLAIVPVGMRPDPAAFRTVRWQVLSSPDADVGTVDAIVADLAGDMSPEWDRAIASAVLAGIPVYDLRQIREMLSGRVEVASLSQNDFGTSLPSKVYHPVKRLIDIAVSILALPVFLPVIAVFAVLIRLESPGPAFFVQPRMGLRGKPFRIYKLRSMRTDMPAGAHFTAEDDPRITRIGRFIRKYRIDEFPQIFNILKGEMSWIGPRPEALPLARWYAQEVPLYMYRHAVRPGITGWAQVLQGNVAEVDAATIKLQYDFYYAKHFSPTLDLQIAFMTVHIMLTGFGSR
jgi:lipopolysaccharide/colanic/teichoic acid biosynthesis glycosyltransferase